MENHSELQLKQLLLVHRHGERVPVRHSKRIHLRTQDSFQKLWTQCHIRPFVWAVTGDSVRTPLYPPRIADVQTIHGDGASVDWTSFGAGGECVPGQLTDKGKETMYDLGSALRRTYSGFLPHILTPSFLRNNLYVRSTAYPRTVESVQYLLAGLFPFHARHMGNDSDITVHISAKDNMYVDTGCARLKQLLVPFREVCRKRTESEVVSLMTKFHSLFPEMQTGSNEISTPGMSAITTAVTKEEKRLRQLNMREIDVFYDTFKAMKASGVALPKGVTDTDLDRLSQVFAENFIGPIADAANDTTNRAQSQMVKRLVIGRFLGNLLEVMEASVNDPLNDSRDGANSKIKLGLFSGHDTTIGPLLISLGLFQGKNRGWPGFASNVAFELFESQSFPTTSPVDNHFVRVKYNNQPVELPFCQKKGTHFPGDSTVCTYRAFSAAIRELIPTDYEKECQILDVGNL